MESYPKVTIDLTSSPALTWVSTNNIQGADISLLSTKNKISPEFMSLGLNYSILDGKLVQEINNVAYASSLISNAEREVQGCTITGTFASIQSFVTTTLNFGTNFPKKILIEYFNSNNSLIDSETIDDIESDTILTSRAVEGCYQIKLTFLETWYPFQICCLQEWLIGALLEYDQTNLISLKIDESCDPITRELPISTAKLEAFPVLPGFDITNPNGVVKHIEPGTTAHITTKIIIDGVETNIDYGTWLVKTLESDDNKTVKISFENLIGRLNDHNFSKSLFYSKIPTTMPEAADRYSEKVITDIVETSNLECEFESGTKTKLIYGFIPYISCREALQQICFINGFTVVANNKIKIIDHTLASETSTIETNDIVDKPQYEMIGKAWECTVTYNLDYNLESGISDLITDITEAGIYSHDPAINISLVKTSESGIALATDTNLTNSRVSILQPGTFKLKGQKYVPTGEQKQLTLELSDVGKRGTNKINIATSGNIVRNNAYNIALQTARFVNRNTLKISFEYITTGQRAGDKVRVNLPDKQVIGWITSQSIDLVNGMVTKLEFLGASN